MVEEYNSIMVNNVWQVVPGPQDRLVVGSRWIYKIKYAVDDSVEKCKASADGMGDPSDGCQNDISKRGLEVWQKKGEIFLGQGRYATRILKRFRMEDCRPMAMPMITNWKKIDASEDMDVDPTLYRQHIGSLMYLVNTGPDICYVVNTLIQFMV
eukprot:PITA_27510